MELFTMSSYLFVKEWYWLKLVTNETVRLRNKTSFLFYLFFFSFLFNLIFFLTNEVVQDWIELIDLESRAEIELIVILFRSESTTFLS